MSVEMKMFTYKSLKKIPENIFLLVLEKKQGGVAWAFCLNTEHVFHVILTSLNKYVLLILVANS